MAGRLVGLGPFDPVANVTPFTYKDGDTYLSILEKLRNGTDELVDTVNANIDLNNAEHAELNTAVNQIVDVANTAVAEAEAAAVAARDAANLVDAPATQIMDSYLRGAGTSAIDAEIDARLGGNATGLIATVNGKSRLFYSINPVPTDTVGYRAGDTWCVVNSNGGDRIQEMYMVNGAGTAWVKRTIDVSALKNVVPLLGTRGFTRSIYVRADGSDATGDGKTAATAYREITTAINSLSADGPVIRGSVVINVGAGSYKGGIRLPQTRGTAQDDYLKIVGPSVGGHPNAPTAIIDYDLDPSATWGILAEDGSTLWLEDIKVVGGFANAIRVERGVFMQTKNVHIDGKNQGTNGYSIQHHCRYTMTGGVIQNCTGMGIMELFNCTRSSGATTAAAGLQIKNCGQGFQAKEGGVGHLDYLSVEGCGVGVELNGSCVANVKGLSLKRNGLALANINSEMHNGQSIVFGINADKNTRETISIGSSAADLTDLNWAGVDQYKTAKHGHRPLITLGADYSDVTITNSTSETLCYQLPNVIMPHTYNVAGKRLKIVAWGSLDAAPATSNGIRFILRFGSILMGEARIPQGALINEDFVVEFDIVCDADGNSQKVMGRVLGYTNATTNYTTKTFNTTDQSGPSAPYLYAIPGALTDKVTMHLMEVWG